MAGTRTRDVKESASAVRPDAYMGMLIVSLVATFIGLIFLLLDYNSYPEKNPPAVKLTPPASAAPR
jgi:hypothetical protein